MSPMMLALHGPSSDLLSVLLHRLFVLLLLGCLRSAWGQASGGDAAVLQAVFAALGAPSSLSSWTASSNPCDGSWRGVKCDASATRVVDLSLDKLRLYGTIPDSLVDLTNLGTLSMNHNGLTGTIPARLGSLQHLTLLDLSNNALTGTIPLELGGAPLTSLALQGNELDGPIPESLAAIPLFTYDPSLGSLPPIPTPNTTTLAPTPIMTTIAPTTPATTSAPSAAPPLATTAHSTSARPSSTTAPSSTVAQSSTTVGPATTSAVTTPPGCPGSASSTGGNGLVWECICDGGQPGQQSCDRTTGALSECQCGSGCPPCVFGQVISPNSSCACVPPMLFVLRFLQASLSMYTPSAEAAVVRGMANTLGLQPQQLIVLKRASGSVVLSILGIPPAVPSTTSSFAASVRSALGTGGKDPTLGTYEVLLVQDPATGSTTSSSTGGSSSHQGPLSTVAIVVITAAAVLCSVALLVFLVLAFLARRGRRPGSGGYFIHGGFDSGSFRPMLSGRLNYKESVTTVEEPPHPTRTSSLVQQASSVRNVDPPLGTVARYFTLEDIHKATGGFSTENVIGSGGSSVVFRGTLQTGRMVAVKQLHAKRADVGNDKEFLLEVELLSRLHHVHLVQLIGYCVDQEERILVYEYMPNGTLREHLNGGQLLDWNMRVNIAVGAAKGLEYLHDAASPKVIHRDFKSTNVLLDDRWEAKVSDFGMAKEAVRDSMPDSPNVNHQVLGTFGYFAPEYALLGRATPKSDVFSFGVVLLELLTGRPAVDTTQPRGSESLVIWACPLLHDEDRLLHEVADPHLHGAFPREDFQRVALLALACLQPDPEQRPDMPTVLQALHLVSLEYRVATAVRSSSLGLDPREVSHSMGSYGYPAPSISASRRSPSCFGGRRPPQPRASSRQRSDPDAIAPVSADQMSQRSRPDRSEGSGSCAVSGTRRGSSIYDSPETSESSGTSSGGVSRHPSLVAP